MEGIEIFSALTAAILGIAYPLLLQAISGLDEKYESPNITDTFKKEPALKCFQFYLKTTVAILVIIGALKMKWGAGFSFLLTDILLLIGAIWMLVLFFILVQKVFTYTSPESITSYLIKMALIAEDKKPEGLFKRTIKKFCLMTTNVEPPLEVFFDLLQFSIKNPQWKMRFDLMEYIARVYKYFRNNNTTDDVQYPFNLYKLQYELAKELCLKTNFTDYEVARKCIGGEWMIDWYQNLSISDSTFKWMFYNLNHVVEFQRDDYFKDYWGMASQHFKFHMQKVQPNYFSPTLEAVAGYTNEEIETRDRLRRRYLEFHIALGGLVLYGRRLEALKFMLEFTQSYPPDYVLLPKTPRQLLELYVNFNDENNRDMKAIWARYPFYGMSGLNADFAIRRWISQYLAILFVYQFTLKNQYTFENHAGFPEIPINNIEKSKWLRHLPMLKMLVVELLADNVLLRTLRLDGVTRDWCSNNSKFFPTDYLDELIDKVEKQYKNDAMTAPISEAKREAFLKNSGHILSATLDTVFKFGNRKEVEDVVDEFYIPDIRTIIDKDGYVEEPEFGFHEYDTFLAEQAKVNILAGFMEFIARKASASYTFRKEDLLKAVKKLGIDESYVILSFRLSPDDFKDIEVKDSDYSYLGAEFWTLSEEAGYEGNWLFVLKKEDLPYINMGDISAEEQGLYNLEKISDQHPIYGTVLDLNSASSTVFLEYQSANKSDEELKRSVLLMLSFRLLLKWKRQMRLVALREYFPWEDVGYISELEDVIPLR